MSIELREGTIEYFKSCLEKQDPEAIASYENELNTCSLMEMHGVNDREVYLHRMSKSTSIDIASCDRGLLGGIFCIHWISNWLKISIRLLGGILIQS